MNPQKLHTTASTASLSNPKPITFTATLNGTNKTIRLVEKGNAKQVLADAKAQVTPAFTINKKRTTGPMAGKGGGNPMILASAHNPPRDTEKLSKPAFTIRLTDGTQKEASLRPAKNEVEQVRTNIPGPERQQRDFRIRSDFRMKNSNAEEKKLGQKLKSALDQGDFKNVEDAVNGIKTLKNYLSLDAKKLIANSIGAQTTKSGYKLQLINLLHHNKVDTEGYLHSAIQNLDVKCVDQLIKFMVADGKRTAHLTGVARQGLGTLNQQEKYISQTDKKSHDAAKEIEKILSDVKSNLRIISEQKETLKGMSSEKQKRFQSHIQTQLKRSDGQANIQYSQLETGQIKAADFVQIFSEFLNNADEQLLDLLPAFLEDERNAEAAKQTIDGARKRISHDRFEQAKEKLNRIFEKSDTIPYDEINDIISHPDLSSEQREKMLNDVVNRFGPDSLDALYNDALQKEKANLGDSKSSYRINILRVQKQQKRLLKPIEEETSSQNSSDRIETNAGPIQQESIRFRISNAKRFETASMPALRPFNMPPNWHSIAKTFSDPEGVTQDLQDLLNAINHEEIDAVKALLEKCEREYGYKTGLLVLTDVVREKYYGSNRERKLDQPVSAMKSMLNDPDLQQDLKDVLAEAYTKDLEKGLKPESDYYKLTNNGKEPLMSAIADRLLNLMAKTNGENDEKFNKLVKDLRKQNIDPKIILETSTDEDGVSGIDDLAITLSKLLTRSDDKATNALQEFVKKLNLLGIDPKDDLLQRKDDDGFSGMDEIKSILKEAEASNNTMNSDKIKARLAILNIPESDFG